LHPLNGLGLLFAAHNGVDWIRQQGSWNVSMPSVVNMTRKS